MTSWRSPARCAARRSTSCAARPTRCACRPRRRSSSRAGCCPSAREPEGPFGEFPQYYGERADRHVFKVDAVTHRRTPIFHTIVGGGLEHLLLGAHPARGDHSGHPAAQLPGRAGRASVARRRRPLPSLRQAEEDAAWRGQERAARRLCGPLRHQIRRRGGHRRRHPRPAGGRMGDLHPLPGRPRHGHHLAQPVLEARPVHRGRARGQDGARRHRSRSTRPR